jgi:hypothetical protein
MVTERQRHHVHEQENEKGTVLILLACEIETKQRVVKELVPKPWNIRITGKP